MISTHVMGSEQGAAPQTDYYNFSCNKQHKSGAFAELYG